MIIVISVPSSDAGMSSSINLNRIRRIQLKPAILYIFGFGIVSLILLTSYRKGATYEILRTQDGSYGKFIMDMGDMDMKDLTSASGKTSLKRMFRVKTTITMETDVYSPNDTLPQIRLYDDAHNNPLLKVCNGTSSNFVN